MQEMMLYKMIFLILFYNDRLEKRYNRKQQALLTLGASGGLDFIKGGKNDEIFFNQDRLRQRTPSSCA